MQKYIIREGSINELHSVNILIKEFSRPYSIEEFNKRLNDKFWIGLVAEDKSGLIGFKVGYELEKNIFYSWLGGVILTARRKGIAKALLKEQEERVFKHKFREIRVKSSYKFQNMTKLLKSNNYKATNIRKSTNLKDNKILFRKISDEDN